MTWQGESGERTSELSARHAETLRRLVRQSPVRPTWEESISPDTPVETPALAGLEAYFRSLARALMPDVMRGRFSVIIADDTAGRVPAILLRDVFNRHLRAAGAPSLPIIFWQSSGVQKEGMVQALRHRADLLSAMDAGSGRGLIVTDWVQSGNHVRNMEQQLRDHVGVVADVATLGMGRPVMLHGPMRIYSAFYYEPWVNGLAQSEAISGMSREKYSTAPVIRDIDTRRRMTQARRDARTLAARIARDIRPMGA